MKRMGNTSWKRRGSSVIYGKSLLTPFVASSSMISLREALSWRGNWPDEPPGDVDTILVAGLEACLDTMEANEAYDFLRQTVRPLIIAFQNRWDRRGLIFGFNCSSRKFEIDAQEQVIFIGVKANTRIRLSNGLWNGAASDELYEISDAPISGKRYEVGGFHVPRLS